MKNRYYCVLGVLFRRVLTSDLGGVSDCISLPCCAVRSIFILQRKHHTTEVHVCLVQRGKITSRSLLFGRSFKSFTQCVSWLGCTDICCILLISSCVRAMCIFSRCQLLSYSSALYSRLWCWGLLDLGIDWPINNVFMVGLQRVVVFIMFRWPSTLVTRK